MGKTEVILLIIVALFVGTFFIIYLENSKKIKAEKETKEEKPEEKKPDPPKPVEKPKKEEKSEKQQQKELEKKQEAAEKELRSVMESISIQSENYIKSLEAENQQGAKKSKFEMKEVSEYEVGRDEAAEEAAIILGVKKQHVHVFDDCEECNHNTHENSSSILSSMDEEDEVLEVKKSAYDQVSLDSFEEDESVAEEFSHLSKRMKVMMMTDVFKKKFDDENQE